MPNALIHQTSPYLLQHAHNPVDWQPWGTEAFEQAKREDKPVLVSIGYSACHWCHVMERESFEDEATARFMNEHFINIKVDREERPDVDSIYMDAVQAISGSGGWPLNVFCTPDGKPFYGGTYFPPRRMYNRSSWLEILEAIREAYVEKREQIGKDAETLTAHIARSSQLSGDSSRKALLQKEKLVEAYAVVVKQADKEWGGFGAAPKFPQTGTIQFLFQYWTRTGTAKAKDLALLSLDKMIAGGIYDHLGGGFARYSTDREWLAPHFEKMLYDNALLIRVLADAYRITKNDRYANVIQETVGFLQRELMHPGGGFYAALDADSEGEEGKFYVWSYGEVVNLLGADAPLFCTYYDVRIEGNWEGHNILRTLQPLEGVAASMNISLHEAQASLQRSRQKLFSHRANRTRPGLDDKILLNWNSLTITALCQAYGATGNESYKTLALNAYRFIQDKMATADAWQHSWKEGSPFIPAFLDDYAFLIEALQALYTLDFDTTFLTEAHRLAGLVLETFTLDNGALLSYTAKGQADILLQKAEIYDGATPSGNSIMAVNLHQLSIFFDQPQWRERALDMLACLGEAVTRYPTSFSHWLMLQARLTWDSAEVAVVGPRFKDVAAELQQAFLPGVVLMAAPEKKEDWPLLAQKEVGAETLIFLCENYACQKPVSTPGALWALMDGKYSTGVQ